MATFFSAPKAISKVCKGHMKKASFVYQTKEAFFN